MTRAATTTEVNRLASDRQWSDVLCHIPADQVVFAARINQATIVFDRLTQLTFDGVTVGAYTDILPGMTVYVGSSAGISDRGIGYARKSATSDTLYLGETSAIGCADNDFLTVIRDFGLWYKPAKLIHDTGAYLIDNDVAYAAQLGTRKSIIGVGGDRVLELTGASVACVLTPTGSASYVTTSFGGTITNGTTTTPTFTASATGDYLIKFVGTNANSTVTTTYRWVHVVDNSTSKNVILTDNSADNMGWSAHLQLYENISTIRDRAKVILYARDYYGFQNNPQTISIGGSGLGGTFTLTYAGQTTGAISWSGTNATLLSNISTALIALSNIGANDITVTALSLISGIGTILVTFGAALGGLDLTLMTATSSLTGTTPTIAVTETQTGSIGSLPGCENVFTTGWIDGKSIVYDVDNGSVDFDVHSAAWWLDQIPNPLEIKITEVSGTPANWLQMASLTVDAMLWNLLENYTTCLNSMDVILTGDTRTSIVMTAPIGSLWSQLTAIANGYIAANSFVNQYGQLIFSIDTPLIPIADRSTIPVVCTLTSDDWEDITVDVIQHNPDATLYMTAQRADGTTVASIGGGRVPGHYGAINTAPTGLIVTDQNQANVLAGSLFERDNCPYKFSIHNLRGNNRLIETNDRLGLTLTDSDNLAGLTYSGYIIVQSVNRVHDPATGAWNIDLEADAETQAGGPDGLGGYTTGDIQVDVGDEIINVTFPPMPDTTFPPFDTGGGVGYPDVPPSTYASCDDSSPANGIFTLNWDRAWINGETGTNIATANKMCTIRSATATYPTLIVIPISMPIVVPVTSLHLYGVDSTGGTVTTAALDFSDYVYSGDMAGYNVHATFSEVSPVNVKGFQLTMDLGSVLISAGIPITIFVALSSVIHGGPTVGTIVETVSDLTHGHYGYHAYGSYFNTQDILHSTLELGFTAHTTNPTGKLYMNIAVHLQDIDHGGRWGGVPSTAPYLVSAGTFWGETYPFAWSGIDNGSADLFSTLWQLTVNGPLPTSESIQIDIGARHEIVWEIFIEYYYTDGVPVFPKASINAASMWNVCPAE